MIARQMIAVLLVVAAGCRSPGDGASAIELDSDPSRVVECPAGIEADECVWVPSSRSLPVTVTAAIADLRTDTRARIEIIEPSGTGLGPWLVPMYDENADGILRSRIGISLPSGNPTVLRVRVAGTERLHTLRVVSRARALSICGASVGSTALIEVGAELLERFPDGGVGRGVQGEMVTFASLPSLPALPATATTDENGRAIARLLRERDGGVDLPIVLHASTADGPIDTCILGGPDPSEACAACR